MLVGVLTVGVLVVAPEAVAAPVPSTAQAWTEAFQERNDHAWSGADQVASFTASNGAVYWLFGDTMLGAEDAATGAYAPGARMIANTILVQRGGVFTPATPAGAPAIPDPAESEKYWAQAAVESGGMLHVFAQRVRVKGDGFVPVGVEIARFQFDGDALVFAGTTPTPSSGRDQSAAPQWSGAALSHGGYAYVYGYRHTGDAFNPHTAYLARVPLAGLASPAAWEFWTGSGWGSDQSVAAPLFDSQPSSVAIIDGRWTILVKPWNEEGSDVLARTADAPHGPFTSRVLFSSPAGRTPEGRNYITYSPQLHPEQPLASGATLVSIAWNGRDFWSDVLGDADLYKPRFHEVNF